MSRYPTTAELAAFRRDIERSTRGGLRVAIFDDVMSRPAGAIDYERRAGIGHPGSALDRALYTDARRESSALRSRAYDGLDDDGYGSLDLSDVDRIARETFAPDR